VSCYVRFDKKEADLLTSLGRLEIEREDETSTLFRYSSLQIRAVDPDTDPAFQVNPDPYPDSLEIRIQCFNDQKLKQKNTAKNF
jgi:hypothetical protein